MRLAPRFAVLILLALLTGDALAQRHPLQDRITRAEAPADRGLAPSGGVAPAPAWASKLDPALAALVTAGSAVQPGSGVLRRPEPLVVLWDTGEAVVEALVRTADPRALRAVPGVELRTVAGDVAVVRARLDALTALAQRADVVYVEGARRRSLFNDTARLDTRADAVYGGGGGLPQAYRGQGVVVGVLDSGLDVTHPAFRTGAGTRVDWLLEYRADGTEQVWTSAQINGGAVTQRDGNGGGGHGTHVTGTAAGSSAVHRGVAPEAQLMFVKGVRDADSNGGFTDGDVIDGTQRMFARAAVQGRPAVVNLSLGGHYGPHDGTSLYEQALSNLTGPGRIVVAAAGNEGGDAIHAGEVVPAGQNETLWLPHGAAFAGATMWYDAGTLTTIAVGAYDVLPDGTLSYLGTAAQVPVGGQTQATFVSNDGVTRGTVTIDATTVLDPRNGDGNVDLFIEGGGGVDVSATVWSVITASAQTGRVDLWALLSEFYSQEIGIVGFNEIPGDPLMTVGTPSTAREVLSVGAHVTANQWLAADGGTYGSNITVGTRAEFSSLGPTRDGRVSPDLTGPGQYIISPLSSHVQPGVGIEPERVVAGGYSVLQGTSMASPHVAGIVALMLQADPSLTPAEARSILQASARGDAYTGALPNNAFGAGKVDALAAVLETLARCGSACGGGGGGGSGSQHAEAEPNDSAAQAQTLVGAFPMTVSGLAEAADQGALSVGSDDIEDLYRVTIGSTGLKLVLSGYTEDLDLFLLNEGATEVIDSSYSVDPTETVDQPTLAPGTYLVGVSLYDPSGGTGTSAYSLRVEAANSVAEEGEPAARRVVLHPVAPNPVRERAAVEFELAAAADVRLEVVDVLGRRVAVPLEGPRPAGPHAVALDVSTLGAGTYVVRLQAGTEVRSRSLVVVR